MRRTVLPIAVILLTITYYLLRPSSDASSDTIEYRGEHFKLRKAYRTFDDYKEDPNNLDTNELSRIEAVMLKATLPSSFSNRNEFTHVAFGLKFPGYGLGFVGDSSSTNGDASLEMVSVEIPQQDKDRCVVVRAVDGHLAMVDDFVMGTATNSIAKVKLRAGKLIYYTGAGAVVREKDLTAN